MFEYVLFDLDGTLTDPQKGITDSVAYALTSGGYALPDYEVLKSYIGPPLSVSFRRYLNASEEESDWLIAKFRERYEVYGVNENELIPGIPQLLAGLREKGLTLAVATCKPQVFAEKILRTLRIYEDFTVIRGIGLDSERTTKAEVIAAALRALGTAPGDRSAVMVGDREDDIIGAKANGLVSVGVRWGFAAQGELERAGAEYIAVEPRDVSEYLCGKKAD